ncbi:MAG: hypothetical protein QE487_15875 [Fluviicola sp.]|nr:hypothetical protein [Fluviicola sp.]
MTKKNVLLSVAVVVAISSCTSQNLPDEITPLNTKKHSMQNDTLKLVISPTYASDVAYGSIFTCKIVEKNGAEMEDDSIKLVLIKSDYIDYLLAHASPKTCEISFIKKEENVTDNRLFMNGFITESKVAWEVSSIGD